MRINYDDAENTLVFGFEHDGKKDIITLIAKSYEIEALGNCFHYAYELRQRRWKRKKQIHHISKISFPPSRCLIYTKGYPQSKR